MILVPLLNPKFRNRISQPAYANFGFGALFARRELARDRRRNDVRGGSRVVVEIHVPDPRTALLDLLRRDQDLPDVLVGLTEMLLQLEHALLQAPEVVHQV